MNFHFVTIFPNLVLPYFEDSILARARNSSLISVDCISPRDFSEHKHKKVDDYMIGGGSGLLMKAEPIMEALSSLGEKKGHVIALSPAGKPFSNNDAKRLSKHENITYYTLLGFDGKDIYSKRKVIEPITFKHNSGRPTFGAPIFYKQKGLKRMIFEYAPDAAFNLLYDNQFFEVGGIKKAGKKPMKKNRPFEVEEKQIEKAWLILYDELESKTDAVSGFMQLNVPSGKVEGMVFERGRWRKVDNLVPRNKKKKNETDNGNYDFSKEKRLY